MHKFYRVLILVAGVIASVAALKAQVVFDTTALPEGYYAPLKETYYEMQAQRFTTDNGTALTLDSISLYLDYVADGAAWNPSVSIYDNTGINPISGTLMGAFASDAGLITSAPGPYSFSGSVALAANTTYWVVFGWNNSGAAPAELALQEQWGASGGTGTWLSAADYTYASLQTDGWRYSPGFALNMTMTAVPEPSTYALFAGLGALGLLVWRRRVV